MPLSKRPHPASYIFCLGLSCLGLGCLSLSCLARPAGAAAFTAIEDVTETGGYDVTATVKQLPASLLLAGQANGDGYRLKLQTSGLELGLQNGAAGVTLAANAVQLEPGPLVVQRRGPLWRVVMNHRVMLQAEDARWHAGQAAYEGQLSEARVQPVEEVFFDDDFMRIKSAVAMADARSDPHKGVRIRDVKVDETIWKELRGGWATTGLSESEQAQVSQSANPFAYKSTAGGANLAVAGRPFWSDYSAAVSVKPLGASSFGLGLYAQDANNYLLLAWLDTGKLQLQSVVDSQVKVLDEAPGAYQENQWYRLRLQVAGGLLRAFVDDAEVLRARTGWFGRGQVALYTNNREPANSAVFDDVTVRTVRDLNEDFAQPVPGRWETIAGKWLMPGSAVSPVPPGSALPWGLAGAYAVTGENTWTGYSAAATLTLPSDAAAGILLHHQTGKGAYLLRINGPAAPGLGRGKAQILKLVAGHTTLLGEAPASVPAGQLCHLVLSFDRGYLRGTASPGDRGEQRWQIDAFDPTPLPAGRAGIFAQRGAGQHPATAPPRITNFEALFDSPSTPWAKVPELYELEQQAETMGGWSTPQGFWIADAATAAASGSASGKTFWHKGTFFGDQSIRFRLPSLDKDDLRLTLDDPARAAATPNQLTFHSQDKTLQATLQVDGKTIKQAVITLNGPAAGQAIEVARRGTFIIVFLGAEDKQVAMLVASISDRN